MTESKARMREGITMLLGIEYVALVAAPLMLGATFYVVYLEAMKEKESASRIQHQNIKSIEERIEKLREAFLETRSTESDIVLKQFRRYASDISSVYSGEYHTNALRSRSTKRPYESQVVGFRESKMRKAAAGYTEGNDWKN